MKENIIDLLVNLNVVIQFSLRDSPILENSKENFGHLIISINGLMVL